MAKAKGEVATAEAQVAEIEQKTEVLEEKIEATETKVVSEPAQDLGQLKAQLESLQKQLEAAQEEAKAHQRNVSKKSEELQRTQARESRMDSIENKMGILAGMIGDLMDRESSEEGLEEKPKKRRSEEYLSKFEQTSQQAKQQVEQTAKAQHQQIVDEVLRQLKSVGLDANAMETEEFAKAENLFLKGKAEEGLEEVKKIVMTKTEVKKVAPQESQEELVKRIHDEERKKILIERGELEAETGQPKGGVKSFEAIEEAFGRGEISFADYAVARSKAGIQ